MNCQSSKIYSIERKRVKCFCGALYDVDIGEKDGEFWCEFNSAGFACIEYGCENTCPTSQTYCREHCDDKAAENVNRAIKYHEQDVERQKEKLDLILESRKTWAVLDLSGVEEDE